MPYKDKSEQSNYQRLWIKSRRESWLSKHGPCSQCGSDKELELHHVDPSTKESHKFWSWSKVRREAELSKCVVLCRDCHQELHRQEMMQHGTCGRYDKGCRCDECRAAHSKHLKKYRVCRGLSDEKMYPESIRQEREGENRELIA